MNGSELPPLCKLTGDGWDSVVGMANASFQACFFFFQLRFCYEDEIR